MRPTRLGVLAGVAVVFAALAWGALTVLEATSTVIVPVPWLAAVTLLLLALALLAATLSLRARLRGRPGTKPVHPITVARMAALSKAASSGGSLLVGLYAGMAVFFLLDLDTAFDRERAFASMGAVLAGAGLVAVALFLERICRVPRPPEEEKERDSGDDFGHPITG